MINAVNEQFSRFVNFAQERVDAGKATAIATKGDVQKGGGTTLEERSISVSRKIDWVSLSRSGEETLKCSTYHNTVDGWYLMWTESWHGSVTAQSGGTADESYVTFSYADDGASVPILRILTLSGANRASRAGRNGRFLLSRQQSVLYAGEIFSTESRLSLTSEEVTAAFNLIPVEWITSDN